MRFEAVNMNNVPDNVMDYFNHHLEKMNEIYTDYIAENGVDYQMAYNIQVHILSNFIGCFLIDLQCKGKIKSKKEVEQLIDQVTFCVRKSIESTIETVEKLDKKVSEWIKDT